jgi:dephospho-CoA kinase
VDKGDLAARLFLDKDLKARTEAILHPLILEEVNRLSKGKPVVFVQVPLLFESGLEDQFDEVWCITCSQETALRRLQQGRSISPEEARRRWNHQMSPEKKAALSDVVIKNDGTREQLAQMLKEKVRDRIGERNQN